MEDLFGDIHVSDLATREVGELILNAVKFLAAQQERGFLRLQSEISNVKERLGEIEKNLALNSTLSKPTKVRC